MSQLLNNQPTRQAKPVVPAANTKASHGTRVGQHIRGLLHKPVPQATIVYDVVHGYDAKKDFLSVMTSDQTASMTIPNASKRIKGFNGKSKVLLISVTEHEGLSRRGIFQLTWVAKYAEDNKGA
jgi:hypothetical protein